MLRTPYHRFLPPLVLLSSLITAPVLAQTAPPPTNYAGWMTRGREFLASPGEGENEIRRNYDRDVTKPRQAGEAFAQAGALATTDAEKYEAWNQSGLAFKKALNSEGIYKAFSTIRQLKGITDEQRAQAAYEAAKAFIQVNYNRPKEQKRPDQVVAEFKTLFDLPRVPGPLAAQGHQDLAMVYAQDQRFLEAAIEYEKAAALDPKAAEQALEFGTANLRKVVPSGQTLTVLDRLYKLRLSTGKTVDTADQEKARGWTRYYKKQWADDLLMQGAPVRAIALWIEVANDPGTNAADRYDLLLRVATTYDAQKDYPAAQAAYDRLRQLPGLSFERTWKAVQGRANAFANAKDYDKARSEMRRILDTPNVSADAKVYALMQIGDYHRIQANEFRAAKTKLEQASIQDQLAIQQYEAALVLPGATSVALKDAVVARAQAEMDQGRTAGAHTQIQRGLEMLKGQPIELLQELRKSDAVIYRAEKDYTNAMASLSLASVRVTYLGSGYAPDQTTQTLAFQMYQETLQAKNWEAARIVVATLKTWGLNENQELLLLSQIELGAGNTTAAQPMMEKLSKAYLGPEDKKLYEELKKKLPAQ